MKRRGIFIAGGLLAALALAGGGYWRHRAAATPADVLPDFVAPGDGPRAPVSHLLGFTVGRSRLDEVVTQTAKMGLTCADTSIRALMRQMREQKQHEIDEKKRRGESVDGVTGASALRRRSPKEANPQVRLSCDDVPSQKLTDRVRPPSRGRLLLVFDSPAHPLRHVSYERTFPAASASTAAEDLQSSGRAMSAVFNRWPDIAPAVQPRTLEWLKPTESEWRFSDLRARVSAINYGPRGVVVSELAEVPWPVRADAPGRR